MALYKSEDIELYKENIDEIINKVTKMKLELLEPKKSEYNEVMNVILDFIKTNKRKVYGGFALNELVKEVAPVEKIYDEDLTTPDIDFYSFDPINDLMKLCNELHQKGFKYVNGREAMHKETYTLFVNFTAICDISYVPRNIYNKMPFKEIKGIYYIHPQFMTIDYLRMLTDPLVSYWRIDKSFKRFFFLQKNYPLIHVDKPIKIEKSDKSTKYALDIIHEYLKTKSSCIVIGFYALNYFINESNITEKTKNIKIIDTPYYEVISVNYRDDAKGLIDKLKLQFPSGGIKIVEHYPFFQLCGHSVSIYLEKELIAIIYSNFDRCQPFLEVKSIKFDNGKANIEKNNIILGTFTLTLLYALIMIMRARTIEDNDVKNVYTTIVSHLIQSRNYYLENNKKTIFDNTIFQEFTTDCKGVTMMPDREKRLDIEKKKKQNKKYLFSYDPASGIKQVDSTFRFSNSSGNPITNEKNKKLGDKYIGSDDEEDEDENENENE